MRDDFNAMTGPTPVARLTPGQQAAAARRAEILGAIGQGLAGRPYGERRALLAHLTPQLAAGGLPPAAVAGFDPTDANLAGVVAQAAQLRGLLSQNS
jgi:hypothetical protein